jgi:hypothetical protein
MSLHVSSKSLVVLAFVAACGGTHETLSAKPSPPGSIACLAAYDGGKPVNQEVFAYAEAAHLPELERTFVRGRTYFGAEQWVEAAKALRVVAFTAPDTSQGVHGSQLYVESLQELSTHAGRTSCFDDMTRDVPLLHDLYCGSRREKSAATCAFLERITDSTR